MFCSFWSKFVLTLFKIGAFYWKRIQENWVCAIWKTLQDLKFAQTVLPLKKTDRFFSSNFCLLKLCPPLSLVLYFLDTFSNGNFKISVTFSGVEWMSQEIPRLHTWHGNPAVLSVIRDSKTECIFRYFCFGYFLVDLPREPPVTSRFLDMMCSSSSCIMQDEIKGRW